MYLLVIILILLLIFLCSIFCCVFLNNSSYDNIKYNKNIIVPIETNNESTIHINPMQIDIVNLNNSPKLN